jgi:GT2 family glycosyltransferase
MIMDVSIIIPSYNRYPFNQVGLYALEQQNFDLSKMEVILIDDASTDKTRGLKKYRFPYHFKYIRNKRNLGLATSRNIGLKRAKGKVIIFLDAEMVVDPNYVMNNYRHHLNNDHTVVIGGNGGARLYSFLFPEYNTRQVKEFNSLLKRSEEVKKCIAMKTEDDSITDIQPIVSKLDSLIPLIHKADIQNFSILNSFIVPKRYVRNLLSQIGGKFDESPIAWMACLGNLSLRKSFAYKVGGFDEEFKTWGSEDVEFAYRLYKAGAKFVMDPKLKRYHQEHPESDQKKKEWKKNILLFQKKHMEIDVCIRSYRSIDKVSFGLISKVIREYHSLKSDLSHIEEFKEAMLILLHQICILESENEPLQALVEKSGIFDDVSKKGRIMQARDEILSSGNYPNLISVFDKLLSV